MSKKKNFDGWIQDTTLVPLNANVQSDDLELNATVTKKGLPLGSGGSGILPIIYIKKMNEDFLNNYLYL